MGGNVMEELSSTPLPVPSSVHAVDVTATRIECLPGCWGEHPHVSEYRAIDKQADPRPAPVVQLDPAQAELIDTTPGCEGTAVRYGQEYPCALQAGHYGDCTRRVDTGRVRD